MIFGISLSPTQWIVALTTVVFALILPFALAGQIASVMPAPLADPTRTAIGYVSLPFILCFLYDRGPLQRNLPSIFFYLYKWMYLMVGIGAVAVAAITGGGFDGGILLFGILTTIVGLMMFWQSWKVDQRHQQAADRRMYGSEEPLDRTTLAILDAAHARASKDESKPIVLQNQV